MDIFTKRLTPLEKKLFYLLDKSRDPQYYSYSLESICSTLGINKICLIKIGHEIKRKLGDDYQVNIFTWNNYTFVGFEYRRLDYINDEKNGVNVVAKYIRQGKYNT